MAQLNLRTRIELAPHRQLAADNFGAFAHAVQPVVSRAPVFTKQLRVDSLSIIAHRNRSCRSSYRISTSTRCAWACRKALRSASPAIR